MTLEAATEVFVQGFCFARSLTSPYVPTLHGDLWVLQDGPGRKDVPRTVEIVTCNVDPDAVLKQLGRPRFRYALAVISGNGQPIETVKDRFKGAGFRLLRREPLFVRTCEDLGHADASVRRVVTAEDWKAVFRASGRRQIAKEHLERPDLVRLYAAFEGEATIGWVKSVAVGRNSWVSNLYVEPERRGKGLGFALMATMLREDAENGMEHSVLLASNAGARLYPRLGYRQVGMLLLFAPTRR
ncbi:MAG TPA: GNAT family N-acetyltransferase [Fimbriimonadaceae bacterium]|nr:GNAT family N-acetyltransferase [Fimbriimonadaceae bacterium]HRJ95487.1 GNAT family N-acetyltransferase [Fimbriimonadaceae bacterium]